MSKVYEPCFMCGKEALVPGKGVIYVRAEINDKWGNHIICMECYKIHYRPERDKKMPRSMDTTVKEFTRDEFKQSIAGLIKLGLVTENPPGDLHLTDKGSDVARVLAQNQWNKDTLDLSTMQHAMLEALYHHD